jgi:spore germination protein
MLKEKTGIGPGLLFMVLFISLFSYGVIESPHAAAKYIGSNGYWGFLLAFMVALPVIWVICRLGKRFPSKSIIQYLPEIVGAPLGKILGFLYLVVVMILMIWASRAISELLSIYFLNRTPMGVSVFIFLVVSTFVAYQGIEGVSRLAAFLFPVTFFFSFLAIMFSFQNFDLENIRPIFFIEGFKIPLGMVYLFYPFISLLTVLMIFPYLTKKQKGFKVITGAAALAGGVILIVIISGIGNYSAPGVLRYSWPVLEVTRKANLPYVVQTFGLFYAATWLSQALTGTGFFYYIVAEGFSELVNGLNYKWFTMILFPITYFLIMLPSGVIDVRVVFPYLCVIGFAFALGLPFLLWLVAVFRKRGNH